MPESEASCNHGCVTIPPPGHAVSRFMNTLLNPHKGLPVAAVVDETPSASNEEQAIKAARVLSLAQDTADRLTSTARAEADQMVSAARANAEQIVSEANQTAETTVNEANQIVGNIREGRGTVGALLMERASQRQASA